jgi:chromosome segregation ATPase
VTARREVPLSGDAYAWVYTELNDLKARLSIVQQAAEQSRALAADAADKAHTVRTRADQLDNHAVVLFQFQEELRILRDQVNRLHDDVSSLRHSRDETERRVVADGERAMQDRNEVGRRFGEVQKQVDTWQERVSGFEELNRRNLEMASQLTLRLEALENDKDEIDVKQTRTLAALNRIDQDINRLSIAIPPLQREDDVNKERVATLAEMLRRIEGEIDGMKSQMNRIDRIHDRVELVQAERGRQGERLNEMILVIDEIKAAFNEQFERITLVETRVGAYLTDIRKLEERLLVTREQVAEHLKAISDLEADFRKRQIAALEKEAREIRSRGLTFGEE